MVDFCEPPISTKESMILSAMRAGQSLNRFDAERLGDHVLPSTVAILRAKGHLILGSWEKVPTRFGRTVRVRRYSYVGRI
jgi:hypothetical protein